MRIQRQDPISGAQVRDFRHNIWPSQATRQAGLRTNAVKRADKRKCHRARCCLAAQKPAEFPNFKAEKCYAIAKAGKNDCASVIIQTFAYPDAWTKLLVWASILLFLFCKRSGALRLDHAIPRWSGRSQGAGRARLESRERWHRRATSRRTDLWTGKL